MSTSKSIKTKQVNYLSSLKIINDLNIEKRICKLWSTKFN